MAIEWPSLPSVGPIDDNPTPLSQLPRREPLLFLVAPRPLLHDPYGRKLQDRIETEAQPYRYFTFQPF